VSLFGVTVVAIEQAESLERPRPPREPLTQPLPGVPERGVKEAFRLFVQAAAWTHSEAFEETDESSFSLLFDR
jgi:hypothetical protein